MAELVIISAEFTRPSDTTAYTAGDVVGPVTTPAVITFTNVAAHNGQSGVVRSIYVEKSTVTVTNATFGLHLYTVAPTPIADNLAWTKLYADRTKYIGFTTLPIMVTTGFGAGGDAAATVAALTALTSPYFKCAVGSRTIYGVLVAVAAYTPASAEQFYVNIGIEQSE